MVIIVESGADEQTVANLIDKVRALGFTPHPIFGVEKTVIAVVGHKTQEKTDILATMPGVQQIIPILKPYKLVGREVKAETSVISVRDDLDIGGDRFVVMAGPCAVESYDQLSQIARYVKQAGAQMLRGGIFKPRTSPHDFQGLREEGIPIAKAVKEETGLPFITEVVDIRDIEMLHEVADIYQVGARNMQNFALLTELGKVDRPVMLKRAMSGTVEDLLQAAEYVAVEGNAQVILCERGIRTFESSTRNTLDISAVIAMKRFSHLPVVVDPSHASGHDWMVPALSKAAVAAGADGLLIETHSRPQEAMVDGHQSLTPASFKQTMEELAAFCEAAGRTL
ncbi:MAG: 3-deoxy-7-phosphoheptulonate synthase [candidate division WS1 bacterium]|jgi:3-deoxy-7-phosphoheptulonate synthase|nr:3-deoxy-7-phosphoheptulonate synthase [candidate division WS1 bacterium]